MTETAVSQVDDFSKECGRSGRYKMLISLVQDAFSGSALGLAPAIIKYMQSGSSYAWQLIERETRALQCTVADKIADCAVNAPEKVLTDPEIQKLAMKLAIAVGIPEIMKRLEKIE